MRLLLDGASQKMKQAAKKTLSLLGVGIYRLNSNLAAPRPNAQGLEIMSPTHHNSRERMNEFYSNPIFVEAYLEPDRLKIYKDAIILLQKRGVDYNGKHIGDIGCGTGHVLLYISNIAHPASLAGFEYSNEAIKIARSVIPSATFYHFDVYDGGVDVQFDVVFCIEVLEHLLYPAKALKTIIAMINRGGVALITVPDGRIDTFEGHINFWSPESWQVFVSGVCNDFEVETGLMDDGKTNFAIVKCKGPSQ